MNTARLMERRTETAYMTTATASAYFDRIRDAEGPKALASAVAEYVDFVAAEAAAAERAAIRAELRAATSLRYPVVEAILDAREPRP